eukprot:355330-Chlamydomonas_euryale.AAC.3
MSSSSSSSASAMMSSSSSSMNLALGKPAASGSPQSPSTSSPSSAASAADDGSPPLSPPPPRPRPRPRPPEAFRPSPLARAASVEPRSATRVPARGPDCGATDVAAPVAPTAGPPLRRRGGALGPSCMSAWQATWLGRGRGMDAADDAADGAAAAAHCAMVLARGARCVDLEAEEQPTAWTPPLAQQAAGAARGLAGRGIHAASAAVLAETDRARRQTCNSPLPQPPPPRWPTRPLRARANRHIGS